MEKPDSTSGDGGSTVYNTVFIDTSLDTHLAMIVSDSETVSDLKKKILYEHPLCFPNIGVIKINALKVKRKGYLYHLSDSMFVKSAFDGGNKSWFLSADASVAEESKENHNSLKPDSGKDAACFGITTNNSSADLVDLLPDDGPSKRLLNINDSSLPQNEKDHRAKQKSESQQFDFGNSAEEFSGDLPMEVEQAADCPPKVLFPVTNNGSKLKEKDVGNKKISENLPASEAEPVLREKHKAKKRKGDAVHDHVAKENSASIVESGKDALESYNINKRSAVLNDIKLGKQIPVDEPSRSAAPVRTKRSAAWKRMADEGTELPGGHSEHEKHNDVSLNEQEYKLTENSSQPGPKSKKKHKPEKKDGTENSLIQKGVLTGSDKQGTSPDISTSEYSLGQNLGSTSAEFDHINAASVKDSQRKKRKKQKSNPTEVGSEISSAKDVRVDTFQAAEAINHKDLGNEADPGVVLGAISESCLYSSKETREVSKCNRVPNSDGDEDMVDNTDGKTESKNEAPGLDVGSFMKMRDSFDHNASHVDGHPVIASEGGTNLQNDLGASGHENQSSRLEDKFLKPKKSSKKIKKSKKSDEDMVDTNDGKTESKNEAPGLDVETVMKTRDSLDHNAGHVDGHPIIASEGGTNLQNELGVSGHENQSGRLEDKFLKPKKSSKKMKKPKKSKDPVSEAEVLDAGDHINPAIGIPPLECPTSLIADRLSDDAEQDGKTDGKEPSKGETSECLPSVTDVRADDVIRDVLESLQWNNGPVNVENLDKKSRKKTKKSSTVDPPELQGNDDVDHRDTTILAEDRSEVKTPLKSTRKTKVMDSSSARQSNESNLVYKNNTGVGISPVHNQLESSQSTLKANHEERPIDDVLNGDPSGSIHCVDANDIVEACCESEKTKSQQQQEIVDSGEVIVDNGTDKKRVETEVKGKKKKQHDTQPVESAPDLLSSQMLGGKRKKAKAQAAKSSSIQSQRSSSKVEPYSSKVQSSKALDHVGGPIRDVVNEDQAKNVVDASKSIEVHCESERIKNHNQHEIVDSGEILVDTVTDKGVEIEVKGKKKKKKKKKPDPQPGGSTPDLSSSKMLNGNLPKTAKVQAAKSSSIQSEISSKFEARSSNAQSSKTLLTVSGNVGRKPLQSNKTDTINSIPKEAQSSIDINISKAHTNINLNKGCNECQSHLDIAKATGSNDGKVINSLEKKKSLLATSGTIFKHDDKESSDDEDGVDHSDDRTRTPSDSSPSDDDSDLNISSSRNGSYNSEGKGGRRNRKKSGFSSPSLSLHEILRNSSSYKKAKLTASQSQLDDLDGQPDEVVPDSQAK